MERFTSFKKTHCLEICPIWKRYFRMLFISHRYNWKSKFIICSSYLSYKHWLIFIFYQIEGLARADPIKVSRVASAIVNSPDDYGAVEGNWGDNFSGGTHPTKWIGSMEILQTFFKKKKPVQFGQCWVFAGVLATSTYLQL